MTTSKIASENSKALANALIPSKDLPIYCNSVTDPNAEVFNQPIKFMEKILITKTNGKWLINGKPYFNISDKEKQFFDEFIIAMKWEQQRIEHDNNLKNQNDIRQRNQ